MKNLFDYAAKELSQDAFLRWLFENYNCENEKVRGACYNVLSKMCKQTFVDGEITELTTHAQWWKIDVIVEFKAKGKEYVVAIEDKTFSNEHSNQLSRYRDDLESYEKYKEKEKTKIFYKTNLKKYCEVDIKKCNEAGWDYYFLDDIQSWYEEYNNSGCIILDDYIEHLNNIEKALTKVSNEPISKWDLINYSTFFEIDVVDCNELKEIKEELKLQQWVYNGIYASIWGEREIGNNLELSFEITGRQYHKRFDVVIRLRGVKEKVKLEASKENKEIVKNYLLNEITECNIPLKLKDHKHCIASNGDARKNKDLSSDPLSYDRNTNDLAKEMIDFIKWFYDLVSADYETIKKESV